MSVEYKRIPLAIEAVFTVDGTIKPKKIIVGGESFSIDKVKFIKRRCPLVVPCVAPLEYTILVDGNEKRIYFEPHSNMWFSIKEAHI